MAKKSEASSLLEKFKKGNKKHSKYFSLEEYEAETKPKFYLRTGFPSLDLFLLSERDEETHTAKYGVPTSRITEFVGRSGSFKSWMAAVMVISAIRQNGYAFYFTTELDMSGEFLRYHCETVGLDYEEVRPRVKFGFGRTIEEFVEASREFFQLLGEIYDHDNPVPILVVLDSLGAAKARINVDRYEKDDGDVDEQTGAHGKSLHYMFQALITELAEYNAAFLYTNHMRADMSRSMRNEKPAHEAIAQWYASLRLQFIKMNPTNNKTTSMGVEFKKAELMKIKPIKKRGRGRQIMECELNYVIDHGFDEFESLLDSLRLSGAVNQAKRLDASIPETDVERYQPIVEQLRALGHPTTSADFVRFGDDLYDHILADKAAGGNFVKELVNYVFWLGLRTKQDTRKEILL